MKIAVFYLERPNLSYDDDWLDALINTRETGLLIDSYNINSTSFSKWISIIRNYEWLIFLHSTNANSFPLKYHHIKSLLFRKGKLAFFVGNEYKLMPAKRKMIKNSSADLVLSQLPQDTADWLYEDLDAKVLSLPHALNPDVFIPVKPLDKRKIHIGCRSAEYPWYLGDTDRNSLLNFISQAENRGIVIDVSLDNSKRFNREGWAGFLNECMFTVATEAGSSYLEKDDRTRIIVNEIINKNPGISFNEVYERVFADYTEPVSGKCISSRHFDAVGTKTCQILFEGRYNDILKPGLHYLELKKDLSNIRDIMERLNDYELRKKIVDNTYEYVMENHTHRNRTNLLFDRIL